MGTRPARAGEEERTVGDAVRRWHVRLLTGDPALARRVRHHVERRSDIELAVFEIEGDPGDSESPPADILVVPADEAAGVIAGSAQASEAAPPVIAYGPPALLRSSFLAGACDYLKDPWTPEELLLRMDRIIRAWEAGLEFRWGGLRLCGNHVHTPRASAVLSHQEAVILRALLKSRGDPVPREALFYLLWGRQPETPSRAVDMHVSALNRKIGRILPESGRLIRTVRRIGYVIP